MISCLISSTFWSSLKTMEWKRLGGIGWVVVQNKWHGSFICVSTSEE